MKSETYKTVIDELDDLLEAERAALLVGDLEKVSRLYERKAGLIDRLATLEHREADALKALNGKVVRNQELLDQAAAGIRKVARRLGAMRQVRTSLDTYDERGTRKSVDLGVDTSFEKRA